jgi:hypothetical protein|tara:strand:+ start:2365 stop:2502 length:138 start_codon:yes stop_codon:yes gene_type:complete
MGYISSLPKINEIYSTDLLEKVKGIEQNGLKPIKITLQQSNLSTK